jgi:hypothetical protein
VSRAQNNDIEGVISPSDYDTLASRIELARGEIVVRGDHFAPCVICGGKDHTARACNENPLLLALAGDVALTGDVWKCFFCGAVYTTVETARKHFGDRVAGEPECRRK